MSNLVIEINDLNIDTDRKIDAVLELLQKARKVPEHSHSVSEPTPYQALEELANEITLAVELGKRKVYEAIVRDLMRVEKSAGDPVFSFNNKVFLNPKTGGMLTEAEWKTIAADMDRMFGVLYGNTKESLVKRAMALGKILQTMDVTASTSVPLSGVNTNSASFSDRERHLLDRANIHTGELIQEITDRERRAVAEMILRGYDEKWSTRQLEDELFQEFSTQNRDWRRVAETETAINFNNGYLSAEYEAAGGETAFVMGVSGGDACDFCRAFVDGKVAVLLDSAPSGDDDQVTIDGSVHTAIWPGKNNFGRKKADWWVATTIHPHCRCTWVRYDPMFEDTWKKIKAKFGE